MKSKEEKKMIIGIASNGNDLSHDFAPNFGRCSYFIIFDLSTQKKITAYPNTAQNAAGGAGIQAAQLLINNKVDAVIASRMGPNAWNVLQGAGISIYTGMMGTIQQNLEAFLAGQLSTLTTTQGFGSGVGRGMGRRMGRGQGRGRGNF
jgi:predicted Fe-Mo cluster-binding NifX family protein